MWDISPGFTRDINHSCPITLGLIIGENVKHLQDSENCQQSILANNYQCLFLFLAAYSGKTFVLTRITLRLTVYSSVQLKFESNRKVKIRVMSKFLFNGRDEILFHCVIVCIVSMLVYNVQQLKSFEEGKTNFSFNLFRYLFIQELPKISCFKLL